MADVVIDLKTAAKIYRKITQRSIAETDLKKAILTYPHLGFIERPHGKKQPTVVGVHKTRWENFLKVRSLDSKTKGKVLGLDNCKVEGDMFSMDDSEMDVGALDHIDNLLTLSSCYVYSTKGSRF